MKYTTPTTPPYRTPQSGGGSGILLTAAGIALALTLIALSIRFKLGAAGVYDAQKRLDRLEKAVDSLKAVSHTYR